MTYLESLEEIKSEAKTWLVRLITFCVPLIIGIYILIGLEATWTKVLMGLFLVYNVIVIAIAIKALIVCWNWKEELKEYYTKKFNED